MLGGIKMNLQQMMNYIQGYTNTVTPNTRRYSYSQQVCTIFPANICIEYPGRKQSGDYLVKFTNSNFNDEAIFHSDIVEELFDIVVANPNLINDYYDFVIDVANNWEHIN